MVFLFKDISYCISPSSPASLAILVVIDKTAFGGSQNALAGDFSIWRIESIRMSEIINVIMLLFLRGYTPITGMNEFMYVWVHVCMWVSLCTGVYVYVCMGVCTDIQLAHHVTST